MMSDRLLMHMGPSIGNYRVLLAGVQENIGFASGEFIEAMKESLEGLLGVMGAGSDYMPFILPGSGTAAMESMTTFLRKGDKVLILSNGVFGDRWARILERYPVEADVVSARAGESVTVKQVEELVRGNSYRMTVMTHVETSTGVRAPVKELVRAVRNGSELVGVDCVASAGGEEVAAEDWGADFIISASQKAIGGPPGMGLVAARREALSDAEDSVSGYFLDLRNWSKVMEGMLASKGGYFATPPISSIFSLREALRLISQEGMEARIGRHSTAASLLRASLEELGLGMVAKEGLRSNTVTGVKLGGMDQDEFLKQCLQRGVEFASGVHPELKGKYFRIGHMGWVTSNDIAVAVNVIQEAMKSMGGERQTAREE